MDRGAIEAAREVGFPYGGLVPKGRKAEDGIVPLEFVGMTEDTTCGYLHRTERNVMDSDATLILSPTRTLSGGTRRTAAFCKKHGKPCFVVNPFDTDGAACMMLAQGFWAEFGRRKIVLNVAGPRESKAPGIQAAARRLVKTLVEFIVAHSRVGETPDCDSGNHGFESRWATQAATRWGHLQREEKKCCINQ